MLLLYLYLWYQMNTTRKSQWFWYYYCQLVLNPSGKSPMIIWYMLYMCYYIKVNTAIGKRFNQILPPLSKLWTNLESNQWYHDITCVCMLLYKVDTIIKTVTDLDLTVVKKSPTHLEIIKDIMIHRPNVMSPVHSTMITVRDMVVLRIPPNWDAAPIRAYFPTSLALKWLERWKNNTNITRFHRKTLNINHTFLTFSILTCPDNKLKRWQQLWVIA